MKFLSCWMFWYPFGIPFYSFSLLLMGIHEQFKRLGNKIRVLNLFLWHKKRRIFYCNYKKEKILTLLPSKTNRNCSTASPTDATTSFLFVVTRKPLLLPLRKDAPTSFLFSCLLYDKEGASVAVAGFTFTEELRLRNTISD